MLLFLKKTYYKLYNPFDKQNYDTKDSQNENRSNILSKKCH